MFVLDSTDINAQVGTSPNIEEPGFRKRVFLAAIEADQSPGLH
jgi:hypothetical protein